MGHFRFLLVVGLTAVLMVAGVAGEARTALACTGPGAVEAMLETEVILEGRVTSVAPLPKDGARPNHTPHALTIEVVRGHRGAASGDRIAALAYLPNPGIPQACATFEFQGDLTGRYLVIGLEAPATPGGIMLANRGAASFVGPEPAGEEYERGRALAEMITDSNADAPRLTLVPSSPGCGEAFRATGERFAPGRYVIRPAFDGRILAVATVGAAGTFDVNARLIASWCSGERFNGKVIALHASALDEATQRLREPDALTEIATLIVTGARDAEPGSPLLRVSPQMARCGDEVEVTGLGFLPMERLSMGIGGGPALGALAADESGALKLKLRIPIGECDAARSRATSGYTQVWAAQAEFGLPGPYFSLAAGEVYLSPPAPTAGAPEPPGAGSGSVAAPMDVATLLPYGVAALAAASVLALVTGVWLVRRRV